MAVSALTYRAVDHWRILRGGGEGGSGIDTYGTRVHPFYKLIDLWEKLVFDWKFNRSGLIQFYQNVLSCVKTEGRLLPGGV